MLKRAWQDFLHNPVLTLLLFLEFLFFTPVTVLFFLFQNASPYLVGSAQLLLFLLIDAFFKAGFFGMAKNVVIDGSTSLREFLPNAKRYWVPILSFQGTVLLLLVLAGLPLLFFGRLPDNGALVLLALVFFMVVLLVVVAYWMLWAIPFVLFKNRTFLDAIRDSISMANRNVKGTVVTALIMLLVLLTASIVSELVSYAVSALQVVSLPALLIMNLLTTLLFLVSTVVATMYVLRRFRAVRQK